LKKNVSKENLEPKIHFKTFSNKTKAPRVTKELIFLFVLRSGLDKNYFKGYPDNSRESSRLLGHLYLGTTEIITAVECDD